MAKDGIGSEKMDRDAKNRLSEFFAEENQKFKSYIHRRIQSISEMDAEDIIGEVMLSVFTRVNIGEPVENLASYVYRSLHNKTVDHLRRNERTLSLENCIDDDGEIPLVELLRDTASNAEQEAERREFLTRLKEAIGRLEPRQRAIFIATEMKGRTFKELSQEWEEPIGTLLSRKQRAVKALQEMLKDFKS